MNEKKSRKFLSRMFHQWLISESFFFLCVKLGVNPKDWPQDLLFEKARSFYKQAIEESYGSAVIMCEDIEIPLEAYSEAIGENEVKVLYSDHSSYLAALELIKKLSKDPSRSKVLCEEYLNQKTSIAKYVSMNEALSNFVQANEERLKNKEEDVSIKGFDILSKHIGGFNVGRINLITASSGFGKTSLCLNLIKNAINDNKRILYINMEMTEEDVTKRFLMSYCHLYSRDFQSEHYMSKVANINLKKLNNAYLTDGSSLSLSDIRYMIQDLNRQEKLDFVFIDYDQKIEMSGYKIDEEWRSLLKAVVVLEEAAKREKVNITLFSQTNDDTNGLPVASKRSIQPCASVIHFTEVNDTPILRFLKNRFGSTKERIELEYNRATNVINEVGYYTDKDKNIDSLRKTSRYS